MGAVSSPEVVEPRTYVVGGETRKRGMFGIVGGWKGLGAVTVGIVIFTIVETQVQSWWPIVIALGVAAAAMIVMVGRTASGDSWAGVRRDRLRRRIALRFGMDRFEPGVDPATGLRVVPSEVGLIETFTVPNGRHKMGVVVHASQVTYYSTVVEIVGGGDGIVELSATNNRGKDFEDLLFACSRAGFPVDEIDVSTRVTIGGRAEYLKWLGDRAHHAGEELADSTLEVAGMVTKGAENYRSWMVVCMPDDQLAAQVARLGKRPTVANKAEHAARVTLEVCRLARRRGFKPVKILSPIEIGGLIRHLYVPSVEADDHADIRSLREGFVPYGPGADTGFVAFGPDGSQWWHASASVPRDGWPLQPVDARFLESLVTDVTPATIRTVTAQHRLVPKVAARRAAVRAKTLDEADILAEEKRGKVSTGESEAQSDASSRLLRDLLYGQAGGAHPALRITVSGHSASDLADARERVDAAAQDAGFGRLVWHDSRHHHGHLLTLPFGRGIVRTASPGLKTIASTPEGGWAKTRRVWRVIIGKEVGGDE